MRLALAGLAAGLACASAPPRDPAGCASPSGRAEIQQVEVRWARAGANAGPKRDVRQAAALASDLYDQCRKGASMDGLQDKYSDAPGGSIVVGPQARVPYRAAALCLPKNGCAVVRSDAAFHVLKRID